MRPAHKPPKGNGKLASLGEPPSGLRASSLELGSSEYVVLSYPAHPHARIPGLSGAESEVLWAAVDGLTNAEIAATRRRSVFTIQNQLAAACRKLGVSSRAEAALKLATLELEAQ
jgi:DNA-binding NarL/FixJ family response regulator